MCMVGIRNFTAVVVGTHHALQVDRDNNPAVVGPMRTKDQTLEQMALIRSQRTARLKAALRTQYGVKETPNALLELPLDLHRYMYTLLCHLFEHTVCGIHRNTPVETLHTVLLGPYK